MKNILIIFGGCSAEHEVSVKSARNVTTALDKTKYRAINVGVSRSGTWHFLKFDSIPESFTEVTDELPEENICTLIRTPKDTLLQTSSGQTIALDVAFPLIHGPMGEDGTLQGLFEIMRLPYVGPGVMASALGMDKELSKKLFVSAGLRVSPSITVKNKNNIPSYQDACKELDSKTLFIKPSIMGSSVGVSKVKSENDYLNAINEAFKYSFKVLIEKAISGREIECSVLGNNDPKASLPGELKPNHEFYSYEAKYLDANGADYNIPAKNLSPELSDKIRQSAITAFQALECKGLSRVDFFVTEDDDIYINEINTLPGFTSISMYPKMWEAMGIPYTSLISNLIDCAEEEFLAKCSLKTTPDLVSRQN
ncbi:MAG: hypothetical protein RLZZ59_473 [Pseudomonadota bacterium]|jgi:D-alanine-D-alanine ligase